MTGKSNKRKQEQAARDLESRAQRICEQLVRREVVQCVSSLVSHFAQHSDALQGSDYRYDDLLGLLTQEREVWSLDSPTYYYGVDLNERGMFRAHVSQVEIDSETGELEETIAIYSVCIETDEQREEWETLGYNPADSDDLARYLCEQLGIIPASYCIISDLDDKYCKSAETETNEALEHWAVSSWFANRLQEHGEIVGELFDFHIWGRTCSGQSISQDGIIRTIAHALEILPGQRNEWGAE